MNAGSANRTLVRICLFAALIAALGLIPRLDLPIAAGVPITAQTLGVMLAGLILGPRAGALAVLLFLLVVALGMPFLAGGRGGLGVFAGPTTGFLIGWVAGAFIAGLIAGNAAQASSERTIYFMRCLTGAFAGGVVTVYLFGIPWLAWLNGMSLKTATLASLVFLPGDLIKVFLATFLATGFAGYSTSRSGT